MSCKYTRNEKDERVWGRWEVLDVADTYIVKRIEVLSGKKLSLQTHKYRDENWVIAQGTACITLGHEKIVKKEKEHVFIPAGEFHRIENIGENLLVFIEMQSGDVLDEEDIIRYDENYQPVSKS